MNPIDTSIARNRNRRMTSISVYARHPNDSGQQNPSPMENPGQPDLARYLLGQLSDGSSPRGSVDNPGFGIPQLPPIPQDPQHGVEFSDGSLSSHIDRSERQPELPRCLTSRSSGVTSVGSRGCLTSTGTPSLGHSRDNFAFFTNFIAYSRYEFLQERIFCE